jgi:cyclohexyl-isocyanide hydratase
MSDAYPQNLHVGMVLFPQFTHFDLRAAYDVFCRMPRATVHLIASTTAPVETQHGLAVTPTVAFSDAPPCDVLFVPGGPGAGRMLDDAVFLELLRARADAARYVTSVCAGSLLLGAAGLLRGYRATTYRMYMELLPRFGAEPVNQRLVVDRNRITGRGVTTTLYFGFVVASRLCGPAVTREIQASLDCRAGRHAS